MNHLHPLAYHHGYGGGMTDWLVHTVMSALVHSVIYGVVFKVMRSLTLADAVLLALVVIGVVFLWSRSRRRAW